MRLSLRFLVIIFFCFPHIGRGQEVRIKLENCTLEKETLEKIKHSFTFLLRFYGQAFNDSSGNSFTARIFPNQKEFLKYSKMHANFNPVKAHAIAFYSPNLREMILHKELEDFPRIFAHELSHALLDSYCKSGSSWMDEGLAELFEDIIFHDSAYFFNVTHVNKIRRARSYLLEGASVVEPIYAKTFYGNSQLKHYALSWGLVLYLYRSNLDLLFKTLRADCSGDTEYFFLLNYPGSVDLFEIDAKSFLLNYSPSSP